MSLDPLTMGTLTLSPTSLSGSSHATIGTYRASDYGSVQAAINAAHTSSTAKGRVYVDDGTWAENLTYYQGVSLIGNGESSIIAPTGTTSGAKPIQSSGGGLTGTAFSLASDAAELSNTVTLGTGNGASFAADDYVYLSDSSAVLTQINRVVSVSTDTLTLADPLYEAFTTANSATCQKLTLLSGVSVEGIAFDLTGYTGASNFGFFASFLLRPDFRHCTFSAPNGAGLYMNKCYEPHAHDIRLSGSGNASLASISVVNSTGFIWSDIFHNGGGFGPKIQSSNGGTFNNVRSIGGSGRTFKTQNAAYCNGSNVVGNNSADTGISITLGSHHITIASYQALDNKVTEGVWIGGTSHHILLTAGIARGNNTWDVDIADSTSHDIYVEGDFDPTKVRNLGLADNKVVLRTKASALPSVASATTITLPAWSTGRHKVVQVTGTTTITSVTATYPGDVVTLQFTGILTFTDGSNLKLAGSMTTSADDTITLMCDGTNWFEIARSAN